MSRKIVYDADRSMTFHGVEERVSALEPLAGADKEEASDG